MDNKPIQSDKNVHEPVPFIPFQDFIATTERNARRLFISLVVAISLLFITNAIWLYAWFSYDYMSEETVMVDGKQGVASYVGGNGDIYNGEDTYKTLQNPGEEIGK